MRMTMSAHGNKKPTSMVVLIMFAAGAVMPRAHGLNAVRTAVLPSNTMLTHAELISAISS